MNEALNTAGIPDPYSLDLDAIDVSDPRLFEADVHGEYFARLREEAPVHYCVSSAFGPFWSVTKFDDIMTVDKDFQLYSSEPAIVIGDNPDDFDSHMVDDACLIVREGKYHFYYKGRQMGKGPGQTKMGLAIADHPQGPYVRHEANPVIPGNHEVLVWPQGKGVAAMIGTTGPKDITNSIRYAEDGIHFTKTHTVTNGPWAGGAYRPEAFTRSGTGTIPKWGVEIGRASGELPFLRRFDVKEVK